MRRVKSKVVAASLCRGAIISFESMAAERRWLQSPPPADVIDALDQPTEFRGDISGKIAALFSYFF